jgi:hypothetical protein
VSLVIIRIRERDAKSHYKIKLSIELELASYQYLHVCRKIWSQNHKTFDKVMKREASGITKP